MTENLSKTHPVAAKSSLKGALTAYSLPKSNKKRSKMHPAAAKVGLIGEEGGNNYDKERLSQKLQN